MDVEQRYPGTALIAEVCCNEAKDAETQLVSLLSLNLS